MKHLTTANATHAKKQVARIRSLLKPSLKRNLEKESARQIRHDVTALTPGLIARASTEIASPKNNDVTSATSYNAGGRSL